MNRVSFLLVATTVVLLVFASAASAQQQQGESSMSGEHSMKDESAHTASALPRTGGAPLVGPVILLATLALGAMTGFGFAALILMRRGVS
jgi:hypothetical protein